MKKLSLTIAALVIPASVADACPTMNGRLASRTKTTTVTTAKVEPKTTVTEKTVLVPTKVKEVKTELVPTVATKTRTVTRGAVRPLALPCPNCR